MKLCFRCTLVSIEGVCQNIGYSEVFGHLKHACNRVFVTVEWYLGSYEYHDCPLCNAHFSRIFDSCVCSRAF